MIDLSQTPQLDLWRGDFGRAYIQRNAITEETIATRVRMWSRMLERALPEPRSILEVGANIGLNMHALSRMCTAELFAVEPNAVAREQLATSGCMPVCNISEGFAATVPHEDASRDLVFTSGVLIHIDPAHLEASCREIHRVSRRFILCSEYFSSEPREIRYRGLDGHLFLRDFGRFWLETCPDLCLIDYGFFWRGAGYAGDLTWWLFGKSAHAT